MSDLNEDKRTLNPNAQSLSTANPEDAYNGGTNKPSTVNPEDASNGATNKPSAANPEDASNGGASKPSTVNPDDASNGGASKPSTVNPDDASNVGASKPSTANPEDASNGSASKPSTSNPEDASNGGTSKPSNASKEGASTRRAAPTDNKDAQKSITHKGFNLYVLYVIICASLFVVAQIIQTRSFRKTQQRILDSYTIVDDIDLQYLSLNDDSIAMYAESLGLSDYQRNSLAFLINNVVNETISRFKQNDSPNGEVQELLFETKEIVDMQLARIKQEYESMQIWYGILTVVFLLFSFFSLYKTDDMISRSEGLFSKIQSSHYALEDKARTIQKEIGEAMEKAKVDIYSQQKSLQESMVQSNQELIEDMKTQSKRIISDATNDSKDMMSDMVNEKNSYIESFKALKNEVNELSAKIKEYSLEIDRIVKTSF